MANQLDKSYVSICSEKTLQANSNGFFMNFAQLVAENAGETWIKNVFGKLKTDKERIRTIYCYEKTRLPIIDVLSGVQEIYRKKNRAVSNAKYLQAEEIFATGDTEKSLLLYSQSVLRAPKTDILPLALLGRAKVHISRNEYSLALADIQLSLKENLPALYKGEAFWKMGICYKALNEENHADVSFRLAEKLLASKMKLEEIKRDKKASFQQTKRDCKKVLPSIDSERHPVLHCASKKLTVRKQKGVGRYVVANEGITTGETLVVEPPYAACLLPEMFGTHCHHCFERLISPVGCPDCSNVAFCNLECRDAALSTYHRIECRYLDLLMGSGMSILSHTALRMITQNDLGKCLEIYSDRSKEKVYSLCTNAGMRPPEDFFQRTLMAAFLLRCLQRSGYFNARDWDRVIPTEEEYRVGELLLFHLQMLQFNAHEIYESRRPRDLSRGSNVTYIGVAVYSTAALLNHQCYSGVTRYFVGKNIVLKALRPFQPEEIIPENYGPIFTRKPLKDRQRFLSSRYWFICDCNACKFYWPTFDEGLDEFSKQIKCVNKNCDNYFTLPLSKDTLMCPRCKKEVTLTENMRLLMWCEAQYEAGFKELANDPQKAAEIFSIAIDTFHRISRPPHKGTHLAQEAFQRCLADSGNVFDVPVKK